jgi:hypothetical protein
VAAGTARVGGGQIGPANIVPASVAYFDLASSQFRPVPKRPVMGVLSDLS